MYEAPFCKNWRITNDVYMRHHSSRKKDVTIAVMYEAPFR